MYNSNNRRHRRSLDQQQQRAASHRQQGRGSPMGRPITAMNNATAAQAAPPVHGVGAVMIIEQHLRHGILKEERTASAPLYRTLSAMFTAAWEAQVIGTNAVHVLTEARVIFQQLKNVRAQVAAEVATAHLGLMLVLEDVWRHDVQQSETDAWKGLQRSAFRSYDHHRARVNARERQEQSERDAVGDTEAHAREVIVVLQCRCWQVLRTCILDHRNQVLKNVEASERQQEEENKRVAARLADVELRRDTRRDRVVKDDARLDAIQQIERDQLGRIEAKGRTPIVTEEENVHKLLMAVAESQWAVMLKLHGVSLALSSRKEVTNSPVPLEVSRGSSNVVGLFPLPGHAFPVSSHVALSTPLPASSWARDVEAATVNVRQAAYEYTLCKTHEDKKVKDLLRQIEHLARTSRNGAIQVDYAALMCPGDMPCARRTLTAAQTLQARSSEELTRRKLSVWGGHVTVRHTLPGVEGVLRLDSGVMRQTDVPEDKAMGLSGGKKVHIFPDGSISIDTLSQVLSTITWEVRNVGSYALPLVGELVVEVSLRFAHLIDAVDELPVPSACYHTTVEARVPFAVYDPYVRNSDTTNPFMWEEGCNEVPAFADISVLTPPFVVSDATKSPPFAVCRRSDALGSLDGGRLIVRFEKGYTPDDLVLLLVQSGTGLTVQSGVVKVGDVVFGELSRPVQRVRDVLANPHIARSKPELQVSLKGPGATPTNVQLFVRALRYWNKSKDPALGTRVIAVEVVDATSIRCFALTRVDVIPKDNPTTLEVPTTKVLYHSKCPGDVPGCLSQLVEGHETPIAPDAVIADVDTDHFIGGQLTVRISSGLQRGDNLLIVPTLAGNDVLMEGETPEPVGIYLEGNRVNYYGVAFATVSYVENESKEPIPPKPKKKPKPPLPKAPPLDATITSLMERSTSNAALLSTTRSMPPSLSPILTENLSVEVDHILSPTSLTSSSLDTTTDFTNVLKVPDYDAEMPICYSEVQVVFDTDGSARVCAVHELLRAVHFQNLSMIPKPGERTLDIVLDVGPTFQRTTVEGYVITDIPSHNETMRASVTLRVTQPICKLPPRQAAMKYIEGSGARKLLPVELCSENELGVDNFVGTTVRVEILQGGNDEDVVWVRDEGAVEVVSTNPNLDSTPLVNKKGSKRETSPARHQPPGTPVVPVTPPCSPTRDSNATVHFCNDGAPALDLDQFQEDLQTAIDNYVQETHQKRDRKNNILRRLLAYTKDRSVTTRTANLFYLKTQIGTLTAKSNTVLEICFNRLPGTPQIISRKELGAVLRCVCYANHSQFPQCVEKHVRATLRPTRDSTFTQVVMYLQIQRVDDPTEFILKSDKLVYRQGANAIEADVRCFPLVPLGEGHLSDPDTATMDGGFVSVESVGGAARGDAIGLMTVEQQRLQYRRARMKPKFLLSIDGSGQLRDVDDFLVGTVEYIRNSVVNYTDLVVRLATHTPRQVTISMVSYLLNIITYSCAPERIKEGHRTFRCTVFDGVNPIVGKAQISLDLEPPIMYVPGFRDEVRTTCGAGTIKVLPKVMCAQTKDVPLSGGYIDVRVNPYDTHDFLSFLGVKPTPDGAKPPPGMCIAGSSLFESGTYLGRVTHCMPWQLRVSVHPMRMTLRTLESFLRGLCYERKSVVAKDDGAIDGDGHLQPVVSPTQRTVTVCVSDGAHYPNVITVVINLANPGETMPVVGD